MDKLLTVCRRIKHSESWHCIAGRVAQDKILALLEAEVQGIIALLPETRKFLLKCLIFELPLTQKVWKDFTLISLAYSSYVRVITREEHERALAYEAWRDGRKAKKQKQTQTPTSKTRSNYRNPRSEFLKNTSNMDDC